MKPLIDPNAPKEGEGDPNESQKGRFRNTFRWILRKATLVFIVLLVFAIIGFPIYLYWDDFAAGRFIILLIFLGGIFPLSALAFYHREVPRLVAQLRIDYAMLGAKEVLGNSTGRQQLDDAGSRWHSESYILHCLLALLATAGGAVVFCMSQKVLDDARMDLNTQRAMQFGVVGAYIYTINLIYRRYTTSDLQPHVYLSCAISLVAGMAFNFVVFTGISKIAESPAQIQTAPKAQSVAAAAPNNAAPNNAAANNAAPNNAAPNNAAANNAAPTQATVMSTAEFTGMGAAVAAILAFALGYFPNLAINWFTRIARTATSETHRRSDALPLSLIDGISELHEARLRDEGIDNVQNLATGDIKDLVERTPFSAQQIVEWVDQSLLYLYVNPGEIDAFRRAGVRSVTDFHDVWGKISVRYESKPDGSIVRLPPHSRLSSLSDFDQRRKDIAAQLATTEHRLDCLFLATDQGPNMDHVRTYWVNVQTARIQTRDILINQVCGSVGHALRRVTREGRQLEIREMVRFLFAAEAALTGKDDACVATPESLYGKAYLKMHVKETAEARRLFERCIEQFPDDPVSYNDIAWMDLQSESTEIDLKLARERARRAVRLTTAEKSEAEKRAAAAEKNLNSEKEKVKIEKESLKAAGAPENVDVSALEAAEDEYSRESANVKHLFAVLAGYRDTLALAEIRLGDIPKGVDEAKQALDEWKKAESGKEPRILDTFLVATEAYLANGKKDNAEATLQAAEKSGYADAKQKEEIQKLRTKMK